MSENVRTIRFQKTPDFFKKIRFSNIKFKGCCLRSIYKLCSHRFFYEDTNPSSRSNIFNFCVTKTQFEHNHSPIAWKMKCSNKELFQKKLTSCYERKIPLLAQTLNSTSLRTFQVLTVGVE